MYDKTLTIEQNLAMLAATPSRVTSRILVADSNGNRRWQATRTNRANLRSLVYWLGWHSKAKAPGVGCPFSKAKRF